MAKVRTVMLAASELFITNDCAAVLSFRVTRSAHGLINIATDFGATMLLALFEFVTHS